MTVYEKERMTQLSESIEEATRFLNRAKHEVRMLRAGCISVHGSAEHAATVRASMDLTRALARLRRALE